MGQSQLFPFFEHKIWNHPVILLWYTWPPICNTHQCLHCITWLYVIGLILGTINWPQFSCKNTGHAAPAGQLRLFYNKAAYCSVHVGIHSVFFWKPYLQITISVSHWSRVHAVVQYLQGIGYATFSTVPNQNPQTIKAKAGFTDYIMKN